MILRYAYLSRSPRVFLSMTGQRVAEFDALVRDLLPAYAAAEQARLRRPDRQRAIGGGAPSPPPPPRPIPPGGGGCRPNPTPESPRHLFSVAPPASLAAGAP